jgi:hypothetical protein
MTMADGKGFFQSEIRYTPGQPTHGRLREMFNGRTLYISELIFFFLPRILFRPSDVPLGLRENFDCVGLWYNDIIAETQRRFSA